MPKLLALRWLIVATLLGTVALLLEPVGRPARAASPAFISVMISRSTSQEADANCRPYTGTVRIADVAAGLAKHGIKTVVGSVVTDWTEAATGGRCVPWFDSDGTRQGQATAASWPQTATLRSSYGWHFVSHSKSYADLTTMTTDAQRRAETCETLNTLRSHGHSTATGMFNPPNNAIDADAQRVVQTCFSYARRYGTGVNTKASTSQIPHQVYTRSVSGGRCNNSALPCYSMPVVKNRRYTLPSDVAATLRPGDGQYGIAQFYRFLTGKRTTGAGPHWDCTSTSARNHYTTAPETYCLNDLWTAIAGRSKTALQTHPAAVAQAWGRAL